MILRSRGPEGRDVNPTPEVDGLATRIHASAVDSTTDRLLVHHNVDRIRKRTREDTYSSPGAFFDLCSKVTSLTEHSTQSVPWIQPLIVPR